MKRLSLLGATFLGLAPIAAADVLYVDANLASGLNDGSSWSDAYQGPDGLRLALSAAVSGDQIFVAQGTYQPTQTTARSAAFALKNGVEIYGGFLGGETSPGQRPVGGAQATILSGDLAGNDGSNLFTDNSYHLITTAGTNETAVLDGFTITGGNANSGSSNNDRGGGILCVGSVRPTIRNCHFVANRCTFGGGAGYINGAAPSFTDCSFIDNVGGSFGGAFDMAGAGQVRFERCWFQGNTANRAGALEIFTSNGPLVLNCVFVDNTATGGSGGGGLWLGSGGSAQVRNSTIVGNSSPSQAAGAGLRNQGTSVQISNCIFWDNEGPGGSQTSANQVSGAAVTYCIVEGGATGVGNSAADPAFVDGANADFRLQAASPAIDAGDNASVPSQTVNDFAEGRRFFDSPTVADTGAGTTPLVDMGALEWSDILGRYYCPSNAHSNGLGGRIYAEGSSAVADNNLVLRAESLPFDQFLIFINGTERAFIANAGGSSGNLCVGGALGRFNALSQIIDTGPTGTAQLAIDLNTIPTPFGPTTVLAGETWHFQAWFRDNIFGIQTANFTDAVAITFE